MPTRNTGLPYFDAVAEDVSYAPGDGEAVERRAVANRPLGLGIPHDAVAVVRREPECPRSSTGEQIGEPLVRHPASRALRQHERDANLDPAEAVRQRAEVARREVGPVLRLRVIRADRVDRAVYDAVPERVDVGTRAERRRDEEALGVPAVVAALVQHEVMRAR